MTGLLICAAYALAFVGVGFATNGLGRYVELTRAPHDLWRAILGLALIALALWLAYAAGGA